ncbi:MULTISPECIES: anti-sigma factor family protein [unclassified Bacillus (in: firmicutes)]|uniref:anti-sigma factor family protein n=1 Tax=unclassified Bacillus (in: firmicutes) TaxID=185979 RepID=UPI002282CA6F|nr:zf-HC2 domain-containing protein [Bacillus sp. S20C3]MCY8202600.1 zf-HC2 domain-containing protein [Bacillus sp. N12A5]MCY8290528.1 zf-HC2 domain-containing protein [Bacillus sp. N13C7]MCY8639676.1 zf-HC2 domain-containing protein [Bacillus sp. S17B2]MCY8719880.1 zf-HC2 domain-containing protein [Bacillus sp. S10C12M]MCY9145784.1 zf-HC2 domain-containing protein [Bacillus sp. T9C1]
MTCFLVRDLLPLYLEGDCRKETEHIIEEHLKSCSSCREMFDMMSEPFELEGEQAVEETFLPEEELRFKQRYYGLLIVKAACGFGAAVAVMLIIKLLI